MMVVVPACKCKNPFYGYIYGIKGFWRIDRAIFQGLKQAFRIWIIITYWRPAEGWYYAKVLKGYQHSCSFHMGEPLSEWRTMFLPLTPSDKYVLLTRFEDKLSLCLVWTFPTNNLAAVYICDHIKIKKYSFFIDEGKYVISHVHTWLGPVAVKPFGLFRLQALLFSLCGRFIYLITITNSDYFLFLFW